MHISPPTNPEQTTCNKNNYYYDNDSNNDRDAFLMHLNLILSQPQLKSLVKLKTNTWMKNSKIHVVDEYLLINPQFCRGGGQNDHFHLRFGAKL